MPTTDVIRNLIYIARIVSGRAFCVPQMQQPARLCGEQRADIVIEPSDIRSLCYLKAAKKDAISRISFKQHLSSAGE